jgi:cytochrome c-type biogenesis protein CcmH
MSPLFWILAAAMIAAVLASVLRPLLARPGPRADDSGPAAAAVRARLAELDADAAAGAIAGTDAVAVRAELERELLQISAAPPAGNGDQRPARRSAFVIGVLLPLFAIALYLLIGGQRPGPALSPEQMVEQLAARLAAEPDDPRGWDMLARSYMVLGRHRDARMALLRLQALSGDSPDLLVRLADAESREAGGSLAGHPAELVAQALALDPKNRAGLWLAGMIAAEQGDKFGALARWKELLALVDPSDPAYPKLEELIRRAEAEPEK